MKSTISLKPQKLRTLLRAVFALQYHLRLLLPHRSQFLRRYYPSFHPRANYHHSRTKMDRRGRGVNCVTQHNIEQFLRRIVGRDVEEAVGIETFASTVQWRSQSSVSFFDEPGCSAVPAEFEVVKSASPNSSYFCSPNLPKGRH